MSGLRGRVAKLESQPGAGGTYDYLEEHRRWVAACDEHREALWRGEDLPVPVGKWEGRQWTFRLVPAPTGDPAGDSEEAGRARYSRALVLAGLYACEVMAGTRPEGDFLPLMASEYDREQGRQWLSLFRAVEQDLVAAGIDAESGECHAGPALEFSPSGHLIL